MYTFTTVNVLFTSLGVFFIWASWGAGRLSVKYLKEWLVEFGLPPKPLLVAELLVTMLLGVPIAMALVQPETIQQALFAGMGWTSLVARPASDNAPDKRT